MNDPTLDFFVPTAWNTICGPAGADRERGTLVRASPRRQIDCYDCMGIVIIQIGNRPPLLSEATGPRGNRKHIFLIRGACVVIAAIAAKQVLNPMVAVPTDMNPSLVVRRQM